MSGLELDCSVGTLDVTSTALRMPLRGNWVATLDIGHDEAPAAGSPATLRVARSDGSFDSFVGTIRRASVTPGVNRLAVTIVGGAGRLLAPEIPALHHSGGSFPVPAGVVAAGIAAAAGERLAVGVEPALDAYPIPRWTRVAGAPWAALDVLVSVLGLGWRVLADGTIWIGVETWLPVVYDAFFLTGDPRDGVVIYTPDGAPLRPGTTIDGERAVEIAYRIEPGKSWADARVELPGDPVHVAPTTPYLASYVGTVKRQGTDGLIDVSCFDERVDQLLSIPLRVGIPCCKVLVPEDTPLRVSFENGDPRGAYAHAIDQDLTAEKAVARVDDITANGTLTIKQAGPEPGPLVIQYESPDGGVNSATITAANGAGPVLFTVVSNPTDLRIEGKITSGHPRVFLTNEGQS